LVNGFIDHLYTPLVTTSNYNGTANLHTLQFTTALAKHSLACSVFNSRSRATAPTVEILPILALRSLCHIRTCRTLVNTLNLNRKLSSPELSIEFSAVTANYLFAISSQLFSQQSESKSKLFYDFRFAANQFVL
jgi:hypothetical protein